MNCTISSQGDNNFYAFSYNPILSIKTEHIVFIRLPEEKYLFSGTNGDDKGSLYLSAYLHLYQNEKDIGIRK